MGQEGVGCGWMGGLSVIESSVLGSKRMKMGIMMTVNGWEGGAGGDQRGLWPGVLNLGEVP